MLPAKKIDNDNVIQLQVVDGKLGIKPKIRYKKDGSVDKRHCNRVVGVSSEVYPYTSKSEIRAMISAFDKRIDEANTPTNKQIASRNKMMFLIGINVGLRASDLVQIKWSFILNEDMSFKEHYTLQPKKTRKTGKFVKIFFNQTVKRAIENYIKEYPVENIDDYIFKSKKGGYVSERSLWKIIVDVTEEAGIKKNVGSHTLRKTWGYTIWHEATDKSKALVMLQQCLNHTTTITTMRYIGIMDEEKKDMYESVEIGLDFL